MEFREVLRRRRMIRSYDNRPIAPDILQRVVDAGRAAPSAGFTQGTALLVLEGAAQTESFWEAILKAPPPESGRWDRMRSAAAIVIPLADKQAYLDRYSEPDKAGLGKDVEAGWPAPYWEIDAAFAAMAILLAATDEGLGALFFAIDHGVESLARPYGVPARLKPIGAITLGHPLADDPRSPSLGRGRRPSAEVVHWGRWEGRRSPD